MGLLSRKRSYSRRQRGGNGSCCSASTQVGGKNRHNLHHRVTHYAKQGRLHRNTIGGKKSKRRNTRKRRRKAKKGRLGGGLKNGCMCNL